MSARKFTIAATFAGLFALVALSARLGAEDKPKADAKGKAEGKAEAKPLFDGKTLKGWKITQFGAHADAEAKDGNLVIPMGDPISGVTREKDDVPHLNYEVSLEAQRVEGSDFFVGLTFPVQDSHASLILGGWSGGVCGISSIDHMDASENSTSSYREFKNGQWYKVRLRVLKDRLEAWVDDDKIVDVDTREKKLSTRVEVEPSKPFGFCTYRTTAALRKITVRELSPEELKSNVDGDAGAGKNEDPAGKQD